MRRRKATQGDLEMFSFMGRFSTTPEREAKARKALEEGTLEFEESGFKDPGEDYTALVANGERLATWGGY